MWLLVTLYSSHRCRITGNMLWLQGEFSQTMCVFTDWLSRNWSLTTLKLTSPRIDHVFAEAQSQVGTANPRARAPRKLRFGGKSITKSFYDKYGFILFMVHIPCIIISVNAYSLHHVSQINGLSAHPSTSNSTAKAVTPANKAATVRHVKEK